MNANDSQKARVGNMPPRCLGGLLIVCASVALTLPLAAQGPAPAGQLTTINAESGNPLGAVLDGLQQVLLSPINFETGPFENAADLKGPAVNGLASPKSPFSISIDPATLVPFAAAELAVAAYSRAGLPGVYKVAQVGNSVEVTPAQIQSSSGIIQSVVPVMSYPVTFPLATRPAYQTLQLLVDQITAKSGKKVLLLDMAFGPSDMLSIGANGETASNVFSSIAAQVASTTSQKLYYRCFYYPDKHTYYLATRVIMTPQPPIPTSKPPANNYFPPNRVGPADSPFFHKSN